MTSLPRLARRLLLVFALAIGTGELAARAVLGNQATSALYVVEPGDGRCLGLKPDTAVTYTGWGLRVPGVVQEVNAMGYRGPARPEARSPGTLRVAAVGDSFTYGMGVAVDESFPAALERALQPYSARQVEVLNFGIPGTNTEEHVAQYERFARRWAPDLVLLLVSPNDVELGDGEGEALCAGASNEAVNGLREHVYLARVLETTRRAFAEEPQPEPAVAAAWLTAQVSGLQEAVRRDRGQLAVVFFGRPPISDDADSFKRQVASRMPGPTLVGEGWMDPEHPEGLPRIPRETHWTPEGNRLAAERVAAWMAQAGLGGLRAR